VPLVHLFLERLVGTIRHECLDRTSFCNVRDLEHKLADSGDYYNRYRAHSALDDSMSAARAATETPKLIDIRNYSRQSHCRGLHQTPMAA